MGVLALFLVIAGGTAYAANTIGSEGHHQWPGEVRRHRRQRRVRSGEVLDESRGHAFDLSAFSVGPTEIRPPTPLSADEIADDSVDSGEIVRDSVTVSRPGRRLGRQERHSRSRACTQMRWPSTRSAPTTSRRRGVGSAEVANNSLTTDDVGNNSLTTDDVAGASVSGSISVSALANGRCTTFSGSVSGAQPGDAAILTTNGSIPNGMVIYAQRALTDAVHIKVCNLSGAPSAAISGIPTRVVTFR